MTQGEILGCQGNVGNHLVITEATAVITIAPKFQRINTHIYAKKMLNALKAKSGIYIFLEKYASTYFHRMPTSAKDRKTCSALERTSTSTQDVQSQLADMRHY